MEVIRSTASGPPEKFGLRTRYCDWPGNAMGACLSCSRRFVFGANLAASCLLHVCMFLVPSDWKQITPVVWLLLSADLQNPEGRARHGQEKKYLAVISLWKEDKPRGWRVRAWTDFQVWRWRVQNVEFWGRQVKHVVQPSATRFKRH